MTKVIIVTGVSRGIGRAIVNVLADSRRDVKIVGIARSEGPLKTLKHELGDKFDFLCADVTDEQQIEQFIKDVADKYGGIDAIVANAGCLEPVQDVNHISVTEWKKLFDINYFSIVSLVSFAMPFLKISTSGDIIFVSSGASQKAYYGWGAYGSSKAALNHFAMTLASEEQKIRAVAVAPGVVDTQMQSDIREKFGPESMTPEALKRFTDLKENNQLLDVKLPATIYANLALNGISDQINGKYLRYNDSQLSSYYN